MGHGVTGLVVAVIFTALALPPLLARLTGGRPPTRITQLAALAPVAVVPATVAVIIAAATAGCAGGPPRGTRSDPVDLAAASAQAD